MAKTLKKSTRKKTSKKKKAGSEYRINRPASTDPEMKNIGDSTRLTYGLTGLQAEELKFKSADFARSQGVSRGGASIDAELKRDLLMIRGLSRDLYQNNEIYQATVDRAVECGVGPGFVPNIEFEDEKLNTELKKRWEKFTKNPEIRGVYDWKETLEKVYTGYLVDGDIGAIMPKKKQTRLQLIEAERIGQGNDLGVELDKFRAPTAYKVYSFSEKTGRPSRVFKSYPVSEFALVANYLYPGQSRGIPKGQTIFPSVHRLNDVLNSEAIAWQINSRMAMIVNKENGAQGMSELMDDKADTGKKSLSVHVQEMDGGTVYFGNKTDKVESFDNKRPGLNFEKTVKMYAGIVGLPFGIPLPILMFDWSGLNYSTMRGLIEQAGKVSRKIQKIIIRQFCQVVWRWKVNQWIMGWDGEKLNVPKGFEDKIYEIKWDMPSFPWVDQKKESEAHGDMLDRGFTTQRAIASAIDQEYTQIRSQRAAEIKEAFVIAKQIEKATGGEILAKDIWRSLAGLEQGKTAQAQVEKNNALPSNKKGKN